MGILTILVILIIVLVSIAGFLVYKLNQNDLGQSPVYVAEKTREVALNLTFESGFKFGLGFWLSLFVVSFIIGVFTISLIAMFGLTISGMFLVS